jgi:hypothetical protein
MPLFDILTASTNVFPRFGLRRKNPDLKRVRLIGSLADDHEQILARREGGARHDAHCLAPLQRPVGPPTRRDCFDDREKLARCWKVLHIPIRERITIHR